VQSAAKLPLEASEQGEAALPRSMSGKRNAGKGVETALKRSRPASDTGLDTGSTGTVFPMRSGDKQDDGVVGLNRYKQFLSDGVFGAKRTTDKLAAMAKSLQHLPKDQGLGPMQCLTQEQQLEYILLTSRARSRSDDQIQAALENVLVQAETELLSPLGGDNRLCAALRTILSQLVARVKDLLLRDPVRAIGKKVAEAKIKYPLSDTHFDCYNGQKRVIELIKSTPGPEAAEAVRFLQAAGQERGCDYFKMGVSSAGLDRQVSNTLTACSVLVWIIRFLSWFKICKLRPISYMQARGVV